jgi:hypothetical protein
VDTARNMAAGYQGGRGRAVGPAHPEHDL